MPLDIAAPSRTRDSASRLRRLAWTPLLFVPAPLVFAATTPLAAESCPPAGPEQAVIVSLVKGIESLDTTSEVTEVPLASFEGKAAKVCDVLEVGDELRGPGGDVIAQVRCPGGSVMTLSGQFRVALVPADEGQDCKVDLRSGDAQSESDEPTGIDSGPVSAGALRTQYEVKVERHGTSSVQRVQVYDGEVAVRGARGTGERKVVAGSKVRYQGSAWEVGKLATVDVQSAAAVLAQVSTSQAAKPAGTDASVLYGRFADLYLKTLEAPADAAARYALAKVQLEHELPREALFQLSRAEKANPAEPGLAVRIPLAQAQAFQQLAQPEKAATYRERALRIDPDLVHQIELRPEPKPEVPKQLEPQTPPGPKVDTRREKPSTNDWPSRPIRPGEALHLARQLRVKVKTRAGSSGARILVTVTDEAGKPVAAAKVEIAASGGSFAASGGARVGGVTDAAGTFAVVWKCRDCVPAYKLRVTASHASYPPVTFDAGFDLPR